MLYYSLYNSPIGEMLIVANDNYLIGLWFKNQKHYAYFIKDKLVEKETDIIKTTKTYLNKYFSGQIVNFDLPIYYNGTPFLNDVWEIIKQIPYGKTITYGTIAKILQEKYNIKKMSSQAVGSAVSKNPIAIIIPCHRVIGANKNIYNYAAGSDKKSYLLNLEKAAL